MFKAINSTQVLEKVMRALDGKNQRAALGLLNLALPQVIPFNRPLGLKIKKLSLDTAEVEMPFKRANKNHLGGLHATALATVGEYAAGIMILRRGNPGHQRVVLKSLKVDYYKQGRGAVLARCEWPAEAPQDAASFKTSDEEHQIKMLTRLLSRDGAELAQVHTHWQVKPWSKVRKKGQN